MNFIRIKRLKLTVLTRAVKAETEDVHRSVVKPVFELRIPEPV